MRSALVFAVIATSSVLALPSARSNPSFVGFPDVLPCSNGDGVTSTTSEAAAAAAIAAGDQALLIGKGVECSGIVGQEYRVDIDSCDLRIFFAHRSQNNTFAYCNSLTGIPNATFVGFPDMLPCVEGDGVTNARLEAAATATVAGGKGGRSIECNDIAGREYEVSFGSCDLKVFFAYDFDNERYSYCESFAGPPTFAGFPDSVTCDNKTISTADLESTVVSTVTSDPHTPDYPTENCNGVVGGVYSGDLGCSDQDFIFVANAANNSYGYCGTQQIGADERRAV